MCHNARLDLINRHFRITRSDWSITLFPVAAPNRRDTLYTPAQPPRTKDNTYFFTRVRGFPGTYRRWSSHHLRPSRNYRWVDGATSAMRPDVHETFVSLHFRDGPRSSNYKIAQKITVVSTVSEWIAAEALVRLFYPLVFFNYTWRRVFRTEWVISTNCIDRVFFFFFVDTWWKRLNTRSFTSSERSVLAFF